MQNLLRHYIMRNLNNKWFSGWFLFCFVSAWRKNQFAGKLTSNFIRSSEHCKHKRFRALQKRSFALILSLVDFWWHPRHSRSQTQWHRRMWILSRLMKFVQFTHSKIIKWTCLASLNSHAFVIYQHFDGTVNFRRLTSKATAVPFFSSVTCVHNHCQVFDWVGIETSFYWKERVECEW